MKIAYNCSLLQSKLIHRISTLFIALIWLINGIYCKILNLVPRHQEIVGQLLNEPYSRQLTILIGLGEVFIAIWLLFQFKTKLNTIVQIFLIATMNLIEFTLVPDLLLWGKFNLLFACFFLILVFVNEFVLKPQNKSKK